MTPKFVIIYNDTTEMFGIHKRKWVFFYEKTPLEEWTNVNHAATRIFEFGLNRVRVRNAKN